MGPGLVVLCALLGAVSGERRPRFSALSTAPRAPHAALLPPSGSRMRCYDCGGPGSSCRETVITCREGERCGFLDRKAQQAPGQTKLTDPSVTFIHHHPACVASHHCNQVETELVGDVTYTTQRDCCIGDLCNSAVTSSVAPACIVAVAAAALAWLLPGLWLG